jgi:arsenite/tail-anchored protein-transporting ATPase
MILHSSRGTTAVLRESRIAMDLLAPATRYLFFTGKGGVGKTSLSCATAIALADAGKRVLLISTDPASNLDQALGTSLSTTPRPVGGVAGLSALNIDPEAAAAAYRERALGPLRGVTGDEELARRAEELSGACTVEIAAFDEFTGYLARDRDLASYDHIVFDTAPTGHTLRLLSLPAAWTDFMDDNPNSASCLGPHTALQQQQVQYREAIAALADPALTTLVLVTRPERGALEEAARTSAELREMGMENQRLIVNGRFTATDRSDPVALALESRGAAALAAMPSALAALPSASVPLRPFNAVGIDHLRRLLADDGASLPVTDAPLTLPDVPPLAALVDGIEQDGRGLVLVMGKGGVGKTTIAAAVACELAARGHAVQLTTTDPAAHVAATVEGEVPNLSVSRIDPAAEVAAYTERVLASRGRDLDEDGLALLREDLKSPCTEEVAVFHAFSRAISQARSGFVVVDTAPTGHTLLLLDTTGAYHHEIMRSFEEQGRTRGATTPLMRLRDPAYTKMLVVTLPETTPVQEASQLQDDLRRAGIEPFGWVINSSLAAAGPSDPLLRARAAAETGQIARVQSLAERVALVPWMAEEPVGVERLRDLARGSAAAAGTLR